MSDLAVRAQGAIPQQANFSASSLNAEQIDLIRQTVAKNATDTELALFLQVAAATGLNPFLKEIWFIKYQTREGKWVGPVIMTSRDGYLSIANKHPNFEGIQSFAIYEHDEFGYDSDTNHVTHRFSGNRGKLIGAWARVKRRGRDPVIAWASYDEYKGDTEPWRKFPSAMTCKVAEAFALKRQFTISGLVTQEELDVAAPREEQLVERRTPALSGTSQVALVEATPTTPADRVLSAKETQSLKVEITDIFRKQSWRDSDIKAAVEDRLAAGGFNSFMDLTLHGAEAFRKWARDLSVGGVPPAEEAPPADDADSEFAAL